MAGATFGGVEDALYIALAGQEAYPSCAELQCQLEWRLQLESRQLREPVGCQRRRPLLPRQVGFLPLYLRVGVLSTVSFFQP